MFALTLETKDNRKRWRMNSLVSSACPSCCLHECSARIKPLLETSFSAFAVSQGISGLCEGRAALLHSIWAVLSALRANHSLMSAAKEVCLNRRPNPSPHIFWLLLHLLKFLSSSERSTFPLWQLFLQADTAKKKNFVLRLEKWF